MTSLWNWITSLARRMAFRTHRSSLDDELREEMQFHLEMLTRDNEARGMSHDAAVEAARRQFGSATMLREASRSHWSLGWIDAVWEDLRYGVRSLIRTPGISVTAVITLALGIGATVAVVALVDATLLHPIPLRDADRIVTICQSNEASGCYELSPGNFISIRATPTALENMALAQSWDVTVSGRITSNSTAGMTVTPNYFSVLGVTPLLGRLFTRSDADASAQHPTVVIVSYAFWQRQLNGDPNVIGRAVSLNGLPRTVIGVLHSADAFPTSTDVWGPLKLQPDASSDRESVNSLVIARLRPGASPADASRDVSSIQRHLAKEFPSSNAGWTFAVAPVEAYLTSNIRPAILLIATAVAGVLLIACANVANLLLVRAVAREREISVRAALGAGRAQVACQLLIEGLLLSLTGGVFGVLLGEIGVKVLKNSVPGFFMQFLPGWEHIGINWDVLALTLAVCIVVGVGFSAFPALRAARVDLTDALKQSGRGSTGGRHAARLRKGLVISEIALAVVLLAAAALLIQSSIRVSEASSGLQPDHVLTMTLHLPGTMNENQAVTFNQTALQNLMALPGVQHAAFIDQLPLSNNNSQANFIPDSRPTLLFMQAPIARETYVTQDYFHAMGIPQISGREFNSSDLDSAVSVVIVNRTLANRYWPRGDALGHTIGMNYEGRHRYTIIGVVGDVAYEGADAPPNPEVYHPMRFAWTTDVAVRTAGDPAAMAPEITKTFTTAEPSIAITQVMTMNAMIARHYAYNRILAGSLSIFAFIALVMAAAGIYGVVSYGVTQRTQEIGIRMALGAKYHTVVRMILVEGARVAAIGVVLGIVGAWFAGNALAFLLYGVAPRDPVTLVTVALVLGAVALAASYFPARRAGRVEPVIALRYE